MKIFLVINEQMSNYTKVNGLLNLLGNSVPEIGKLFETRTLINGEIFHNDLYSIEFYSNKTVVYVNHAIAA